MQTLTNPQMSAERTNIKPINIIYVGNIAGLSYQLFHMESMDVRITQYNNGIIAYNEIKNSIVKPDVMICDHQLYGIPSIDFYQMIRRIENFNPVFILISQGKISEGLVDRAFNLQIDDVIEFPFKRAALSKRIQFLIKNKTSGKINPSEIIKDRANSASILKRSFDILFASIALIMLSPLLLIVAILIKIDSKGPVFFTSKRVGSGYKIFNFYKFRSMKTGAENLVDTMKDQNQYKNGTESLTENDHCTECEELGQACSAILFIDGKHICEKKFSEQKKNSNSSFMKFKNDPRVTKLGQFIRKTSIDELPQLINILKGDMSFVGNRPLPLYEAEQLTSDDWAERFNAPAGLTGLWQVTKRGKSDMSEEERKQLDNTYAKTHSFLGDIALILKTIPALTQKENV